MSGYLSIFDLFSIGIGPSSSHTVGPMRAAHDFVSRIGAMVTSIHAVEIELYGSLAATGQGHGTVPAALLGLEGWEPASIPLEVLRDRPEQISNARALRLGGAHTVPFRAGDVILSPAQKGMRHPNAIRFALRSGDGGVVAESTYYSVGGGFIEREGDLMPDTNAAREVPYFFASGRELLAICEAHHMSVSEVVLANELALRSNDEVRVGVLEIWTAMRACAASGVSRDGVLPGGLQVRRRSPEWNRRLGSMDPDYSDHFWQERVNLVALAVNEENASGGRVVTAPTNGAAGIIPAVLFYATTYTDMARSGTDVDDIAFRFLLVAAGIGSLYKLNASISGAEVGCQGEVGSASSMAAGALAEILGGTPAQVENAAEIAMEHNLGLTCDPVGGLVQIPCIERNALASTRAINAARMAILGDGVHHVSLDTAIRTMRETGADMSDKYKETSSGGLATNFAQC